MAANEPRIRLVQLLKLFGIAIGLITAIAILAAEWPIAAALAWHVHHGSNVALEGHTFHIPLLYEPDLSKGGRQIEMIEYPRMMGGFGSVTVESTGKTMDEGSGNHWQSSLLNLLKQHASGTERESLVTLHGRKLTFVCVDTISESQESLICHAVGTDIIASTMASSGRIEDTREVLETSN